MEFVAPLARIDPIYKEEEEAFKVRFAHKLVVSRTPLPPFAHKLFVSSAPLPPLRTSFRIKTGVPSCWQALGKIDFSKILKFSIQNGDNQNAVYLLRNFLLGMVREDTAGKETSEGCCRRR